MNTYIDQIRTCQTVVLRGDIPNRPIIIKMYIIMGIATLLSTGVLYDEMGLIGLVFSLGIALVEAFIMVHIWRTAARNRDAQVIHIGSDGLFTRGVLVPWRSIELFDVTPAAQHFTARLAPEATVKIADVPNEEAMRLEVARQQGLIVHTAGQELSAAEIADLCRKAMEMYRTVEFR
ncbi:hypothetical protein CKALI_11120 [Corynebacterium kalinowskii]|uniref:Uncharacterized protein n=1 Tax=Corynebacterium kalinowskii TaxID=2675216 RepID=A0A6B8W0E8_9CORY|nr:hypothetical protein [Corynebacterium kalinowskii]QGU03070.1 hypothetical protein CKALI_11120 [Corynebacterium kalinowskii]